MRATVRTLNENGQHALTTVRRACPARPPRTPPLAIAGGPRLLLVPARYARLDGVCECGGAAPSPSASLTNCTELTFEGTPCYAEAVGATARQA